MKTLDIQGSVRSETGSKIAKQLRSAGQVPCELYGGENVHFQLSEITLKKLVYTPDVYQVNIDLGSKKVSAVIREVQFHPVSDAILHADFVQLQDGKPAIIDIPVVTTGAAIGVMNGGKLRQVLRKLKLKALPADLPEVVSIDVTKMRIGHSIRVSDVDLPGVQLLDAQDSVILSVKMARGAVDVDEEEEGEEVAAEGEEVAAEA